MPTYQQHPSSFRDPSGFVFEADGKLYRQINTIYAQDYELLMRSGLYNLLKEKQWLIPHAEVEPGISPSKESYKTILPQFIPFLSYPYEWCFEQLQDAALLTLDILKASVEQDIVLKDATPYNIQFLNTRPVLIDTLSFEKYNESKPWIAYRQFCEMFLFPLIVSHYSGIEVNRLFVAYPEGIPAPVTAHLLPNKAKFNLGNWLYVFLPASIKGSGKQNKVTFSKPKLMRIVEDLQGRIAATTPSRKKPSAWKNYYEETILSDEYLAEKQVIIKGMIEQSRATSAIDMGCNRGVFSRLLSKDINHVVAIDSDHDSISSLYRSAKQEGIQLLPLCVDLTNPIGEGGFGNKERKSFTCRLKFELVLALALMHHLCIGKNIPFRMLAEYFASICKTLIIEFVPKSDEKVQQLLQNREDIFDDYSEQEFENSFELHFQIETRTKILNSQRIVYLMKRK